MVRLMNAEVILKAIQQVHEVGFHSPTAQPPDILGVLMNQVAADGKNLGEQLDLIQMRCEITPEDVDTLLTVSEVYRHTESPKERRDRLIDVFVGLVEADQVNSLPPDDFNPHEMED